MSRQKMIYAVVGVCLMAGAIGAGFWGYRQWQNLQATPTESPEPTALPPGVTVPVKLSQQARKNLGLVAKPLQPTTYWRVIDLPGVVADRPGISDRGVVAPIAGIVTQIHAFPGATIAPDAPLFTLRLVSESLHTSQLELYKATREIEISQRQRERLSELAQSGALAKSRIIEIDNQIDRLQATVDAYRQDLQARGLMKERIAAAAKGEFVTEMVVRAPGEKALRTTAVVLAANAEAEPPQLPFSFELQSLNVELGQQVDAGSVLCHLADHRTLLIEGHGFKDDMPLVQEAARNGWEVEVDLDAQPADKNTAPTTDRWPPFPKKLKINHLSNTVDEQTRTFAFFLPLENQWQDYTQDNVTRLLWRFRPGSRVRLRVAVEKLENVFVVPQQAVVREGPEAFVFRQNGDLFDRRPVHVLYEDRLNSVLANDGALSPGFYVAQSGAASLNRVMKAQAASGAPANVHVHPDGTVHGAH
ncbi:MAG: efflux RND transporter periplasmic adaptor subunit [Pirellulaceae bacterium]